MSEFEKKLLKLKKRMEECDHLFIKKEEGFWAGDFHSSEYIPTIVTCLKCGLNNQPRDREYDRFKLLNDPLGYYWNQINDEVFRKQYQYPSSKSDESTYNFISDEKFRAINPLTLYQISIYINPNGTNEEIFNTMKELNEIQHKEGIIKIDNKKDNKELLDRLKDRLVNEKRLIKK